jgi:hypothetical protein
MMHSDGGMTRYTCQRCTLPVNLPKRWKKGAGALSGTTRVTATKFLKICVFTGSVASTLVPKVLRCT